VRPFARFVAVATLAATLRPGYAQMPTPAANPAPPGVAANGMAGLCQCLYPPSLPNTDFGKAHLRFACFGGVDQCKSDCNTTAMYSFIPTAPYSCAAPPAQESNKVVSSQR
jgi:hypothetical protein